jgi:hypothetical protein
MKSASYKIVARGKCWSVNHDGNLAGEYQTKEAAFEAAASAASNAIKNGLEIEITVPGSDGDKPALG